MEISLIEIKTEESEEYRSIIIHELPAEEVNLDHEKRIRELEKLVIGLANSQASHLIKLEQNSQKEEFLFKSELMDFATNFLKEEQKKSNETFLKKSTRETAEIRQEIEDISQNLLGTIEEN